MVLFQSSFVIFCFTHGSLWQFLALKDLYIQANLRNKFLKKLYNNKEFWPPQKHHIISMQHPSHKCLPEKSCLQCLRILFDHGQSNSKKRSKGLKNQIVPIFHSAKFRKNSQSWSRVMRMRHFWTQNSPFVLNKIFLVRNIVITFIYLLALFIVQNFKNFLQRMQSYDDAPILGPKWSTCLKQKFFLENY